MKWYEIDCILQYGFVRLKIVY